VIFALDTSGIDHMLLPLITFKIGNLTRLVITNTAL